MNTKGHHAVLISDRSQAGLILSKIGADPRGLEYMAPKEVFRCIKLKKISCPAANLIKQEMLAKGGEAAVSRNTIYGEGLTDMLLSGTLRQYALLLDKLKQEPFGLKEIAADIEFILNSLEPAVKKVRLTGGRELELGKRTLIMGILNVTPDSFSDGGKYLQPEAAAAHAREMVAEGADIIDIGGASSRPGTQIAGEEEEIKRIMPVVEKLAGENVVISIDTFRARVARAALEAGAHIINDIGRLQLDPGLAGVLAEYKAPVVLMDNRMQLDSGKPYEDLIADITADLGKSIEQAVQAGVGEDQIIIDPGVGFGKTLTENLEIIKQLQAFKSLGKPVLLGVSRKSFMGQVLDLPVEERLEASLAVLVMGIMNGADILRVHDVRASVRAARMADAVMHNG